MREFLENFVLYQEYTIQEKYEAKTKKYLLPIDFIGLTFDYYCETEEKICTFEVELDDNINENAYIKDVIPDHLLQDKKLDYTFKANCKCMSCKEYHIFYLLHVYSNKPIPKSFYVSVFRDLVNNQSESKDIDFASIFIEKVGVHPEIKPKVNNIVLKYFDRESKNWYYKGMSSILSNFGIGALAYFRRIIEKELLGIIDAIKELPDSDTSSINRLLAEHKKNENISTIYENIFEYLPNSLKSLGNNPIQLLYNQTSEGLHNLKEKESLEKAKIISGLLEYVIIRINEEKSEIKKLRDSIKNL